MVQLSMIVDHTATHTHKTSASSLHAHDSTSTFDTLVISSHFDIGSMSQEVQVHQRTHCLTRLVHITCIFLFSRCLKVPAVCAA